MNEKSFASRRVLTQPWTKMGESGAVLLSASLTEVAESIPSNCRMLDVQQVFIRLPRAIRRLRSADRQESEQAREFEASLGRARKRSTCESR